MSPSPFYTGMLAGLDNYAGVTQAATAAENLLGHQSCRV